jgi:hypothetical protein
MRLNPKYPAWFHHAFFWDYYGQRMYEEALQQAELGYIPGSWVTEHQLAAVHRKLGHAREAKEVLTRLLELYPTYNLTEAENFLRVWNVTDELISEALDGLRKAGLPDDELKATTVEVIEALLPAKQQ